MSSVDSSDQVMDSYAFSTQPSYLSPYELICAIETKTRFDYIKGIIDLKEYYDKRDIDDDLFGKSIVSLPSKKERDCTVCSDKCNPATSCKRPRAEFTKCNAKGCTCQMLFEAKLYVTCVFIRISLCSFRILLLVDFSHF